jgi:hypothetical protein
MVLWLTVLSIAICLFRSFVERTAFIQRNRVSFRWMLKHVPQKGWENILKTKRICFI